MDKFFNYILDPKRYKKLEGKIPDLYLANYVDTKEVRKQYNKKAKEINKKIRIKNIRLICIIWINISYNS